jgi:hypothetical protein
MEMARDFNVSQERFSRPECVALSGSYAVAEPPYGRETGSRFPDF